MNDKAKPDSEHLPEREHFQDSENAKLQQRSEAKDEKEKSSNNAQIEMFVLPPEILKKCYKCFGMLQNINVNSMTFDYFRLLSIKFGYFQTTLEFQPLETFKKSLYFLNMGVKILDNQNDELQLLPDLSEKQQNFVMRYVLNGNNATEAYSFAYDCSEMNQKSIYVEACRLLDNPKISPWIEHYKKSAREVCEREFQYSVADAMREYNELQSLSMLSSKTYNVAKGCIDGKCRINGLGEDKKQTAKVVINMQNIEKDGKEISYNVGEEVQNA